MRLHALALDNLAFVRSRITSRSNSAKAPDRWNTNLPPGAVVSICSCRLRKPLPVFCRPDGLNQVSERAAEPVSD